MERDDWRLRRKAWHRGEALLAEVTGRVRGVRNPYSGAAAVRSTRWIHELGWSCDADATEDGACF